MLGSILIGLVIIFLISHLYYFFTNKSYKASYMEPALLYKLVYVLLAIMVGFAFLYYIISFGEAKLIHGGTANGEPIENTFLNNLYFSGVTLLTIGYGDMAPVGILRFFSLIEASLGVLLPSVYFMHIANRSGDKRNE